MVSRSRRSVSRVVVLIAATVTVAACGEAEDAPTASTPGDDTSPTASEQPTVTELAVPTSAVPLATEVPAQSSPQPTPPDTSTPASVPVPVVGVYQSVAAYPACGNEPFVHEGVTWYPLIDDPPDSSLQPVLDDVLGVDREEPPDPRFSTLARVETPGPGDDVGTLVVWADGVGRWISDSGDLDVWVIDDEITYDWVC